MFGDHLGQHLVKAIEGYLISHEPEIQRFLLIELAAFSKKIIEFIDESINKPSEDEKHG
jgi:hypothetical protein